MKSFTKSETKGLNMSRQIYANRMYMIHNNHIKNCDVTVRYIDVTKEIWGKDIDALEGNTTQTKTNLVAGDMRELPKICSS